MGTIVARKRKDGSTAYNAQIAIKRKGVAGYREAATFERRPVALVWIKWREDAFLRPGALEAIKAVDPTLSNTIDRYIRGSLTKIRQAKALVGIRHFRWPGYRACGSRAWQSFARRKPATGVQPQAIANYLSHLFAMVWSAWLQAGQAGDGGGLREAAAARHNPARAASGTRGQCWMNSTGCGSISEMSAARGPRPHPCR